MKINSARRNFTLSIAASVVALSACTVGPEPLNNTTIYRGLSAKNNGAAKLSPGEFRFNPDLSTSTNLTLIKKNRTCAFGFIVSETGNVVGLPGYTAENTPTSTDPDHWSIYKPNNKDDEVAKKEVSDYAKDNKTSLKPDTCQPK